MTAFSNTQLNKSISERSPIANIMLGATKIYQVIDEEKSQALQNRVSYVDS
ncbi:MAG: hypothetical protein N2235_08060 [Fischerella sp.]|nr:hypothetical protein [Fischerella sp.]